MSDITVKMRSSFINKILEEALKQIPGIEDLGVKFIDSYFLCKGKASFVTFQFKGNVEIVSKNVFVLTISLLKLSNVRLPRALILKNSVKFIQKKIGLRGVRLKVNGKQVMIDCSEMSLPVYAEKITFEEKNVLFSFSVAAEEIIKKILKA